MLDWNPWKPRCTMTSAGWVWAALFGGLPNPSRDTTQGKKGRNSVVVYWVSVNVCWTVSHWYQHQHVYDMRKFLTPPLMRLHSFENPIFRDWSLTGIDCDLTDESRWHYRCEILMFGDTAWSQHTAVDFSMNWGCALRRIEMCQKRWAKWLQVWFGNLEICNM